MSFDDVCLIPNAFLTNFDWNNDINAYLLLAMV